MAKEIIKAKLYINGEWVETVNGSRIDDISPSDHSVVARVHTAGPEEVNAAMGHKPENCTETQMA